MAHDEPAGQVRLGPAGAGAWNRWPPPAAVPSHEQFFSVVKKTRPPVALAPDLARSKPAVPKAGPSLTAPRARLVAGPVRVRGPLVDATARPRPRAPSGGAAAVDAARADPVRPRPSLVAPKPRMSWDLDLLTDGPDVSPTGDYATDLEQSPSFVASTYGTRPMETPHRPGPQPLPDLPEGRGGLETVGTVSTGPAARQLFPNSARTHNSDAELRMKRKYTKKKSANGASHAAALGILHAKPKWKGVTEPFNNDFGKVKQKRRRRRRKEELSMRVDGSQAPVVSACRVGEEQAGLTMSPPFERAATQTSAPRSASPKRKPSGGHARDEVETEAKPQLEHIDEDWALIMKSLEIEKRALVKGDEKPNAESPLKVHPIKSAVRPVNPNPIDVIDTSSEDDFGNNVNAPLHNLERLQDKMIQNLMDAGAMSGIKKKRNTQKQVSLIKKRKNMSEYWKNKMVVGKGSSFPLRIKRPYTVRPLTSENVAHMDEAIAAVLAQPTKGGAADASPDAATPRPAWRTYHGVNAFAWSKTASSEPHSQLDPNRPEKSPAPLPPPPPLTAAPGTKRPPSEPDRSTERDDTTAATAARLQQVKDDLTARFRSELQQQQLEQARADAVLQMATMQQGSLWPANESVQLARPIIRVRHRRRRPTPSLVRMSEAAFMAGATVSDAYVVEDEADGLVRPAELPPSLPRSMPTSKLKEFLDTARVSRYKRTCSSGLMATVEARQNAAVERMVFVARSGPPPDESLCFRVGPAACEPVTVPGTPVGYYASPGALAGWHSMSGWPSPGPGGWPSPGPGGWLSPGSGGWPGAADADATDPAASPAPPESVAAGWAPPVADSPYNNAPVELPTAATSRLEHNVDTSPACLPDRAAPPSAEPAAVLPPLQHVASSPPSLVVSRPSTLSPVSPRRLSVSPEAAGDACAPPSPRLTSAAAKAAAEPLFPCNQCATRLPSLSEQVYHEIRHHMVDGGQFRCLGCPMTLVLGADPSAVLDGLLEHYLKHVDATGRLHIGHMFDTQFHCAFCKRAFNDPALYGSHEVRCLSLSCKCTICGAKFESTDQLKWHDLEHLRAPDGKYCCDHCDSKFAKREQLLGHRRFHFKDKNVECPKCGKKFLTTGMLTMHNKWKHSQGPCRFCGRPFTSATARQAHEEHMHLKYMMHTCDVCHFRVMSASQLRVHKRSHSADTPHTCADCDVKFFSKNLLRKHRNLRHCDAVPARPGTDERPAEQLAPAPTASPHSSGEMARGADGAPTPAELRQLFDRYKATWTGTADSMTLSDLDTTSDEDERRDQEDIQVKEALFKTKDKNSFSIWSCPVCKAFFTKLWGVRAHITLKHPGASLRPVLHDDKDTSAASKQDFLKEIKRNAKTAKRELKMEAKRQARIAAYGDEQPRRGRPRKNPLEPPRPRPPVDPSQPRKRGRPRKDIGSVTASPVVAGWPSPAAASWSSANAEPKSPADQSPATPQPPPAALASPSQPTPSLKPPPPPPDTVERRHWKCQTCDDISTSYDDLVTHTYIAHPDADLPRFEVVVTYVPKSTPTARAREPALPPAGDGTPAAATTATTTTTTAATTTAATAAAESQEDHDAAILDSARVRGAEKRRAPSATKVPAGAKRRVVPPVAVGGGTPSGRGRGRGRGRPAGAGGDSYRKTYSNSSRRYRADEPGEPAADETDRLYCYCRSPYDEVSEMIGCDNDNCKHEWFHFECVGIVIAPKGKWFCPDCNNDKPDK